MKRAAARKKHREENASPLTSRERFCRVWDFQSADRPPAWE